MIKCCAFDGLEYFRKQEINTVMITGDNELTAKAIGKELGITRIYANVLPEQKLDIVINEIASVYNLNNEQANLVKQNIIIGCEYSVMISLKNKIKDRKVFYQCPL